MEEKAKKIKKLVIGELVANIVFTVVYFIAFLVMLFVFGFAAVFAAIISALFGGEPDATIPPEGRAIITILLILSLFFSFFRLLFQ